MRSPGTDLPADNTPYDKILRAIVQRFIELVGAPAAVNVARRIPGLIVDHQGNIIAYDQADPVGIIKKLIDEYGSIFYEVAGILSEQAVQPSIPAAQNHRLQGIGILPASLSPIKILLVEDHVLFRAGIVELLALHPDFTISGEAGTMQTAIALARELHPDVVLMDITLPDGTGLEATISILAEMPMTKIVFLTVHDDDDNLFAAIRAGGVGYLTKDTGVAELVSKLRGVMRGEAALTPSIARRILEEFSRLPPAQPETVELTDREIEIVRALARGASNREIAARLVITENTVKNHVQNVLLKLHLHSRHDVVDYAHRHGLLSPSNNFRE